MKKVFLIIAAVGMFACSTSTTSSSCQDSSCMDSTICKDSLNLNDSTIQIHQADSLHKVGKL